MAPKWPKMAPKWPQNGPKWPQNGENGPKMAPKWPKWPNTYTAFTAPQTPDESGGGASALVRSQRRHYFSQMHSKFGHKRGLYGQIWCPGRPRYPGGASLAPLRGRDEHWHQSTTERSHLARQTTSTGSQTTGTVSLPCRKATQTGTSRCELYRVRV